MKEEKELDRIALEEGIVRKNVGARDHAQLSGHVDGRVNLEEMRTANPELYKEISKLTGISDGVVKLSELPQEIVARLLREE